MKHAGSLALYGAALVLSAYLVWIFSLLFGGGRRVRTAAALLVAAGAQLQFVIDAPMETVIDSLNVTAAVSSLPELVARPIFGRMICSSVALTAMNRVDTTFRMTVRDDLWTVHYLDAAFDEIAEAGVLRPTLVATAEAVVRQSVGAAVTKASVFYRTARAATERRESTEAPGSGKLQRSETTSHHSHLVILAPPLRLLGGAQAEAPPPAAQVKIGCLDSPLSKISAEFIYAHIVASCVWGSVQAPSAEPGVSHEDYRPPASAVAVDGATWRLGIDGRPYYATAQKASGRMTAKRHQVFFGVRQRAVLNWGASDGALSHVNILAKMRGWSLKHPGDPRLKRDDADADEKPDENSGAHCVFSWLIKIYNKNLSSVAQVNHVTRNRVRRPARNRVRRIMK